MNKRFYTLVILILLIGSSVNAMNNDKEIIYIGNDNPTRNDNLVEETFSPPLTPIENILVEEVFRFPVAPNFNWEISSIYTYLINIPKEIHHYSLKSDFFWPQLKTVRDFQYGYFNYYSSRISIFNEDSENRNQFTQFGQQQWDTVNSQNFITSAQTSLQKTNIIAQNNEASYKLQSRIYSVLGLVGLGGLGYFFYKTKDSSLPQLTFQAVFSSLKDNLKNNTSAFIYGGLWFFGLCNAVRSYKTAQECTKISQTNQNILNVLDHK